MRFNLLGGPGAGKSTTAANLFADMKRNLVSVEHVGEYVKSWAYEGRKIERYDQLYLFGKQLQYEYRFLKHVRNIVTDSPVILCAAYADPMLRGSLIELSNKYDLDYPAINIFLRRNDKTYLSEGRFQTLEQAKELDEQIYTLVRGASVSPLVSFDFQDYDAIRSFVLQNVTRR